MNSSPDSDSENKRSFFQPNMSPKFIEEQEIRELDKLEAEYFEDLARTEKIYREDAKWLLKEGIGCDFSGENVEQKSFGEFISEIRSNLKTMLEDFSMAIAETFASLRDKYMNCAEEDRPRLEIDYSNPLRLNPKSFWHRNSRILSGSATYAHLKPKKVKQPDEGLNIPEEIRNCSYDMITLRKSRSTRREIKKSFKSIFHNKEEYGRYDHEGVQMILQEIAMKECPKKKVTERDVRTNKFIAITLINSWGLSQSLLKNKLWKFIARFANERMQNDNDPTLAKAIFSLTNFDSRSECDAMSQIFGSYDFYNRVIRYLDEREYQKEPAIQSALNRVVRF